MTKHYFLLVVLAIFLFSCQPSHKAAEVLPQYTFKEDPNYMQSLALAQTKAVEDNKLLLVVLGAQWCHDSTGLAATFSNPQMHDILQTRFETIFIDLAYFEDRHNAVQKYGYPAFFGTPTVMVIDPKTNVLLNHNTISKWQNADSVPFEEYIEFFKTIDITPQVSQHQNSESHLQLELFMQKEVERLKKGFDHLRPIWESVRSGNEESEDLLEDVAEEVWNFRVKLQKDFHRLHEQIDQNNSQELDYPEYDELSWEAQF